MFNLNKKQLFLCLILSLFTTSCSDSNPVHNHSDGHTDADGFILEDENGNELYREFQGASTGSINIMVVDTIEISVHFLDHDENEIEHEDDDHELDESSIAVSEFNSQLAIVEVESHNETEEEHHESGLHIIGVSAGETEFKLELMHGDHADYTSTNNVPVLIGSSPTTLKLSSSYFID